VEVGTSGNGSGERVERVGPCGERVERVCLNGERVEVGSSENGSGEIVCLSASNRGERVGRGRGAMTGIEVVVEGAPEGARGVVRLPKDKERYLFREKCNLLVKPVCRQKETGRFFSRQKSN